MTIKSVVQQLNRLYLGHNQRSKYLIQTKDGYFTKNRSNGDAFLNDGHLQSHLKGRSTVGVFANFKNESSFTTFDLDFADDWERCLTVAHTIMDTLEDVGIGRESIFPSFSGNKGLHIDLFFDNPVQVDTLKRLYWFILHESGLAGEADKIEFRPTQRQGVKIPLGFHQQTMLNCYYVDDDLETPLPYDFIERIEPLDSQHFIAIVEQLPSLESIKQEAASLAPNRIKSHDVGYDEGVTVESLEKVFVEGFPAHGTRHNHTFRLALMFRDVYGYDKQATLDNLTALLERHPSTFSSTYDEAVEDTKQIVHDVFDKENDYKLTTNKRKHVDIDDGSLWSIVTATDKNGKALTPNRKRILFALYVHWKRHDERDVFYMSYEQMTEGSGVNQRRHLKKGIEALEAAGYITIVRNDFRIEGNVKHEVNRYSLHLDTKKEGNPSAQRKTFTIQKLSSQSLNRIIGKAFNKKQLRRHIPRRQLEELIG